MSLIRYTWNQPANVSRDAKYMVRHHKGKMKICLYYRSDAGEEWFLSTADHAELVSMVNSVKVLATGIPGGAFYINEYRQVIVPVSGQDSEYYYAGEYAYDLEFTFEGRVITNRAVNREGRPLQPGEVWEGIHPGIPYSLKAGGRDIFFKRFVRPDVIREERLSHYVGAQKAAELAARIRTVKGFEGGRFYVNERRHIFAPLNSPDGVEYVYICDLAQDDPWFPKWTPASSDTH